MDYPRTGTVPADLAAFGPVIGTVPGGTVPATTLAGGAARARWPNRSSKPVRSCNPRLGRFDSGAAPLTNLQLECFVVGGASTDASLKAPHSKQRQCRTT